MSQTALDDQGTPALTGRCAWCGDLTGLQIELEKARYSARDGIRRVIKPARSVWCCTNHQRSLVRRGDES